MVRARARTSVFALRAPALTASLTKSRRPMRVRRAGVCLRIFRSESEARAKEKEMESSEGFQEYMQEMQALSDGEPKFLDITEPWISSK